MVRKPLSVDNQNKIAEWFWPVFENKATRDNRECVLWDRIDGLGYGEKTIRRIKDAPVKFMVKWNGQEYVGFGVKDTFDLTNLLVIPGLGVVASGDLRPATLMAEREIGTCAIRIIVPSRNVDYYNPERVIEVMKKLD